MTEAIRDIYHMCGGVSEKKPSTGLGGGQTHTHTHSAYRHAEMLPHCMHVNVQAPVHLNRQINSEWLCMPTHNCIQSLFHTHTHIDCNGESSAFSPFCILQLTEANSP